MTSDFRVSKSFVSDLSRWINELGAVVTFEQKFDQFSSLINNIINSADKSELSSTVIEVEELYVESKDLLADLRSSIVSLEAELLPSSELQDLKPAAVSLLQEIGKLLAVLQPKVQDLARGKVRLARFPSVNSELTSDLETLRTQVSEDINRLRRQTKDFYSSVDRIILYLRRRTEEYESLASKRII